MVKGILINRKTDESFKSQLKMEHADLVAEMQAVENLPTHERLQLARLRRAQQLKVARQKEKEWLKLQRAKGVNLTTLNGMSTTHHHFRNGATSTGKQHISFENSVVLLEAASRNDMHEVAELLERGITPDAANEDGLTALHQCCIDNNVEMLKLLLDYGASVDAQDSDKWTPLHAAATCGHLELVRILIDHGANLLAVNTDGNMPYDLCDDESTLDYIEAEMSKRGVTQELIDDTRSATERQMLQDLIDLSRNGGDLEQPDEHGATPLHVAAANGYMKVVEFLLEMHVNVDALDRDMWSPVHAAACWGHLEVLEILAQFGADLNIKNKDDETPSDICEDPEIRERIEQLKTEQESKRLAEAQRRRVRRSQSNNTRAQSVRRTSLRDKTLTTKKDAVEEARLRLQAQEVFIVAPDSTTMDPNGADIDYNDATADISPSSSSNWLTKTISSTTSSSHNNHNNNNTLKTNHNHQHRSFYDAASLNHHNNSDAVDSSRTFSLQQNQQQQQQQKQQHSYQPRRPPEGRENDELQMKAFKGNNEMQQQQQQKQQQQLPSPLSYPPIFTRYYARTAPQALQPLLQLPQQQQQQQQQIEQQQYLLTWPQIPNKNIFNSYEPEAEFVPLEEQERHQQNNQQTATGRHNEDKPFDVEVVSGDINGGSSHLPGVFFHQAFPFLGNSFFNSFGGFGIGTQQEPWWKGPNVCTEKEEDEKVMDENDGNEETETADGTDTTVQVKQPYFGQFHFSMNSCVEKPSKYICKRIVNKNGRKKTLTITRQCCHGYGRPRNAAYATPCDKIEIKDIESTAADLGSKDFVIKAKNSGLNDMITLGKNMTMFLPVDEAFNTYSDLLQSESNLVEKQNDDGMKQLFLRHVVDGEVSMDEVRNEQILKTQVDGQNIRINSYQVPLSLSPEPYRYTANCVPILKHDKLAEQGMIHTLDGIMKPVDKNLMDIIRDRRDMSIMRTVLEKTKLSDLLEGEKPMTIFVPTDDAFDKLESHLRRVLKEGKGCASNILKNHMLDLTFCSVASVPGAKTTAYNLLGEPMRFNRSKLAGEATALEKSQPIVINGMAKVVETDIMGTNGVLHVIDTIMPTETALPLSSLMQEKNVTIFRRLLEASGLDNTFDDMDNLTMFAPIDKALEGTKWAKMLEENPEQLINNDELNEFLTYHVAKPMIKTCDLKEQLMPTLGDGNIRINLFSTHSLFTNVMNRATANCARLVHFDDESCGSVLHQVDKPLIPPKTNLLEMLQNNPNYSKFLELVQAANLTELLINPEEDYTLLVPKNDVFEELDENITKDPAELENLIKTHIVNDVICCAGIIPTNWPFVRSIESLNGHHLRITRDRRPKIQNAGITKCDAMATNGIIHEMNDIVIPSSRQPQQPQRPQQHFSHHPQEDIFSDLFF